MVALHRQIRFVEVTEAVHRSIVADQYDEVSYARHVHEAFTDLSMKRASLREIVDATSDLMGTPIVLEDLNRQVLAFAAHGISAPALIGDWERRSRLTPLSHQTTVGGPESWLCSPVGPPRNAWGRLVAPADVAFPERARMTLERAAQALALHRMIEQDRTALELRAQSGLIDDMRRGRVTDEAEATARAHALGLRPALTYLPLTVQVAETFSADQVFAQRRRNLMLDAVRHAVQTARYTALTTSGSPGRIDLLASQPPGASPDALADVCGAIRDSLARLDGVSRCAIGVGPESTRLIDAAADLIESAHIAEVALALPASDKVFHRAADIRLRGLLALIRTDPRVQAFAETELPRPPRPPGATRRRHLRRAAQVPRARRQQERARETSAHVPAHPLRQAGNDRRATRRRSGRRRIPHVAAHRRADSRRCPPVVSTGRSVVRRPRLPAITCGSRGSRL